VVLPSIVAMALAVACTQGCHSEAPVRIPDELVGMWKTPDPKYASSYLQITNALIVFGTQEGTVEIRSLDGVTAERAEIRTLYTIDYSGVGGVRRKFSFYYDPRGPGTIRLRNQQHIKWLKEMS